MQKKKKKNNELMPNASLKKTTKKWVYIGVGLAVFILIAAGGFWFWNKSKSSNEADSTEEEDINPEELPPEIQKHRKKNWIDSVTGISNYSIPAENLPANLSVSQAKDELLEAYWRWWGEDNKVWDKKRIAKILEKNAPRINLADKKGNEDDPLFETKFLESVAEKYQPKNIFSSLPKQNKFSESIREIRGGIHFLKVGFELKYKGNKKIDWVASLQARIKDRGKNQTKTQQEADFAKMTNYLEREHKPFIRRHISQFPSLTNLKELNQWTHTLVKKEAVANRIAYERFFLGRYMGKNVLSPARGGIEAERFASLKNEKFGLVPFALDYKL